MVGGEYGEGAVETQEACDADGRAHYFFQEEAGIRVRLVTGVQTCAIPILRMFHINSGLKSRI